MLVWESKSNRDTFACEIKYTWSGEFVAPTRSASVDGAVEEFHELDEGNEAKRDDPFGYSPIGLPHF